LGYPVRLVEISLVIRDSVIPKVVIWTWYHPLSEERQMVLIRQCRTELPNSAENQAFDLNSYTDLFRLQ